MNYIDLNEETRDGYLVTRETKELWNVLLELACELKRICDKYGINYFLHTGSLLGAVRHRGFIPWDDDMDFTMMRDDFDRFMEVSDKELDPDYYLQTYKNPDDTIGVLHWGRVVLRKSSTTGIQDISELMLEGDHGIGIDIDIIDTCPEEPYKRFFQLKKAYRICKCLYLKYYKYNSTAPKPKKRSGFKLLSPAYIYQKRINGVDMCRELEDLYKKYSYSDSRNAIVFSELFFYRNKVLKKEWYSESVNMKFENYDFPVPVGYKNVLETYYGNDYMKFPDDEHKKGHHYRIFNVNVPYSEYLRPFQEIFKETNGKKIVVFGAGKMLKHYLRHTDKRFHPVFVTDNDKRKWGTVIHGCEVRSPEAINEIPKDKQYVIICSIYYREIRAQLEQMGINNYYIYVQNLYWL